MSEEKLFYETKCRRCGHMTAWYVKHKRFLHISKSFDSFMYETSQYPRFFQCEKCEMKTLQDITTYGTRE